MAGPPVQIQKCVLSVSYRFELRAPVAQDFRRIALEQIDRVARGLPDEGDRDTAIHESRKGLKRLRALLRLVRPAIGDEAFKTHNAAFRDIGQLFSQDRDQHVLLETMAGLESTMERRFAKTFAKIKTTKVAVTERRAGNGQTPETLATQQLDLTRKAILGLAFEPDSFSSLQNGLQLSYRRGRRLWKEVFANPSSEGFHDLRKCVQQQWRHMQLLSRAWPDLFAARVAVARKLSQILGDDHDLAVLAAHIEALPPRTLTTTERRAILKAVAARQKTLRRRADPLCAQLYAEPANRFGRRIAAIWRAAAQMAADKEIDDARPKPAARAPRKPAAKRRAKRRPSARPAA